MNKPLSKSTLREFLAAFGQSCIENPTINDALIYLREVQGVYIWATPMKWNTITESMGHCGGIQWIRKDTPHHSVSSKLITYPKGGCSSSHDEAIEYTIIWYIHHVINESCL